MGRCAPRPLPGLEMSTTAADLRSSQAPEYPFPFAIDEMYDAYKLLYATNGKSIGMSGLALNVVITGDSA